MSVERGELITEEEYIALKKIAEREVSVRSDSRSIGSMSNYNGDSYKYDVIPTQSEKVLSEHIRKITEPLDAIWGSNLTQPINSAINADVLNEATAKYYALSKLNPAFGVTGCAASCTGLCSTGCYTACSGCTGSCTGSCDTSCLDGCTGSCKGSCDTTCQGSCQGGCDSSCNTSCSGECKGSCKTNCALACSNDCSDGCVNSCRGCYGDCTGDCRGCTGSCSGCEGTCAGTCENGCGGNTCQGGCLWECNACGQLG